MDFDPVALLRCWAVEVDVGGRLFTIPAMPASDWLVPILEGAWFDIVPGLLADADEELHDALIAGTVPYEECRAAAQAALATASGSRRWWSARTLARAAMTGWVSGDLVLHGVDLDKVSLAAFLAAAYRSATVNMDRAVRGKFDMDLDRPPAGLPPEEWFDEDEAEQNFMAAMGLDGGGEEDLDDPGE